MHRAALLGSALALLACEGTLLEPSGARAGGGGAPGAGAGSGAGTGAGGAGATGGGSSVPMDCKTPSLAAAPSAMRRLTPDEYTNTARDLLGSAQASPRLEAAAGDIIAALEV